MLRLSTYFALACVALFISAPAATAEDVKWTVAETSGAVSLVAPMAHAHQPAKGEALAPGATLTTGGDGKVVFGDGKTVITVGSNSRLTLPADPSDAMTRFTQDLGSVFFKVEKRPMQHFEVETPLIAAVVKGTQFTVTAGATEHAVEVTEGLVEVVAMTGGQKQMVPAGHSARVRADAPTKLKYASGAPAMMLASASGTIARTIGAEPIDYAVVTNGLVAATPVATTARLVTTKSDGTANNGGSNATDDGISAAAGGTDAAIVGTSTRVVGGVVSDVVAGVGDAGGGGGINGGTNAGAGAGGSGGVGVVVDLGAGTGTGAGAGSGAGVTAGAGAGPGIGVGIGVGGTPPGQSGGTGGNGGLGLGLGVGGTPPGQSGGIGVGVGVGNENENGHGNGQGINVHIGGKGHDG